MEACEEDDGGIDSEDDKKNKKCAKSGDSRFEDEKIRDKKLLSIKIIIRIFKRGEMAI